MLSPSQFRDLVSGRRRGLWATTARGLLRVAEIPYTAVVEQRNRRFDAAETPIHRLAVPVVSVGNVTLGGTGKTPLVRWIVQWLAEHGIRAAIVSRGYGAGQGDCNDEALELARSLPGVTHVQNVDRVAAAQRAILEFDCQAIVLDDGFQHRRLARDLDIVLIDAREPDGFGHVFPRGTLREPLRGVSRADVLVVSHADAIGADERRALRQFCQRYAPHTTWCETRHAPSGWVDARGRRSDLPTIAGRRVAAFAGIGNSTGFVRMLEKLDCEVVAWREFPDHFLYTPRDVASLTEWIAGQPIDYVLSTHKDIVKIGREDLAGIPLRALEIEIQFLTGEDALVAALDEVCKK